MKKTTIYLFILFLFYASNLMADQKTVYLRNGNVLKGEIVDQTASYIDLKLPNDEVKRIPKQSIKTISYRDRANPAKVITETVPQIVEDPTKNVPVLPVEPPPVAKKPSTRVVRDPLNRHYVDFYAGGGSGNLSSQSVNFFYQFQNLQTIFSEQTPFLLTGAPKPKANGAASGGIIYRWKRFSFEGGGLLTHSTTASQNIGPEERPLIVSGSYPEEARFGFAKTSYSVLARSNFELYPTIGFLRLWNRTTDDQSTIFQEGSAAGKSVFHSSENQKGGFAGIGFAYHFGSKFEIRTEYQALQMKGSQSYDQQYIAVGLSDPYPVFILPTNHSVDWMSWGSHLSLKLTYFWKYGIGFWFAYDSYRWKYNFQGGNLSLMQRLDDDVLPPDQALLLNLTHNLYANFLGGGNSKADAVQLGVSKSINFGSEEEF